MLIDRFQLVPNSVESWNCVQKIKIECGKLKLNCMCITNKYNQMNFLV